MSTGRPRSALKLRSRSAACPGYCDDRDDHRCGAGIAAVEHDVAFGPGDEEGRGIRRANVVQVAGDAERLGGPLPAALRRVQPPADEDQCENTRQSQEDYEPESLGELGQPSISPCKLARPGLFLATQRLWSSAAPGLAAGQTRRPLKRRVTHPPGLYCYPFSRPVSLLRAASRRMSKSAWAPSTTCQHSRIARLATA